MKSVLICLIGLVVASCATQSGMTKTVVKRAAFDLDCSAEKITTIILNKGAAGTIIGAKGCGQRASYLVKGDGINGYTAIMNSDSKKAKK